MGGVTVELTVGLIHITALPLFTRSHVVSQHSRPTNGSHNRGSRAQFVSSRTLTVARRLQQGRVRPRLQADRDRNVDRSEPTARGPQSSRLQEAGHLRCIGTSRDLEVSSSSSSSSSNSSSSSGSSSRGSSGSSSSSSSGSSSSGISSGSVRPRS